MGERELPLLSMSPLLILYRVVSPKTHKNESVLNRLYFYIIVHTHTHTYNQRQRDYQGEARWMNSREVRREGLDEGKGQIK